MLSRAVAAALLIASASPAALAQDPPERGPSHRFEPADVFNLEYASDPQISPDGESIVYARVAGDIMTDRFTPSLWLIDIATGAQQPIAQGPGAYASPRWSPDGGRIAYVANEEGGAQLRILDLETRVAATVARLPGGPSDMAWSPDGARLALALFTEEEPASPAALPPRPEGAEWADPVRVIESTLYRFDGAGYLSNGYVQLYEVPADGGTPRQLTYGQINHDGALSYSRDGERLIYAANGQSDWLEDPIESDIYALDIASGEITRLTDRDGPDAEPALSPDGARIAFTGFDDRRRGYQVTQLYVMDADGGEARALTGDLDRSVSSPVWAHDGRSIYFLYDDEGDTKLARTNLQGAVEVLTGGIGGATLGRPYSSGSFTVGPRGRVATVVTSPDRPADVAIVERGEARRLTGLNEDLLGADELALVEEIRTLSSADDREIQAWIAYPPGFDENESYPLILEIHGGPFANYGPRFSAEIQLYAAAGYVVVFANPRGSTSYGEEFGDLIHHNYPSEDYDDLMSVVDAVIERGSIDTDRLYVTGGSGGGVLTAWIVGQTDRFRAAVVAKPVINWTSFVLTSDVYPFFAQYWFPGPPWENQEHYWARSPLSLVGNVTTPTMLLTGEADYRTPISESEQYYQALRLRGVDTRLVRIPGAPHGIASRPSHLIAKIAEILAWFEAHAPGEDGGSETAGP